MAKTGWVYYLRKEELIHCLEELKQDTQGTVEELRKRLAHYITREDAQPEEMQKFAELELRHTPTTSQQANETGNQQPGIPNPALATPQSMTEKGDQLPVIPPAALATAQQMTEIRDQPPAAPTPAPRSQIDDQMPDMQWRPAPMATSTPSAPDNRAIHPEGIQDLQPRRPPPVSIITVMDQVRKWALRYDGSTNPLLFAERIEELTATHQLPLDLLPKTMPIVLTDKALLWYRNNNKQWNTWALFKKDLSEFFLPRRYWDDLDDQVRRRKQRPGESFKDFVLAIQDIMRPAKFPEEVALERIFLNSAADYQLYIRKTDFKDLRGLLQLAEEFERIQMLKATSQPKPPVNTRTPPV